MTDAARERLKELSETWNRLEARAKSAEQFREEAIVAAINEMRYAGRRIVDILMALEGNGWNYTERIQEDMVVARNYLANADHDITDGIIFFAHKRIRRVLEWYGIKRVRSLCPEYEKLYPELLNAQSLIQLSREDRSTRNAEYDKLATDYVPKLMALHQTMKSILALRLEDDFPHRLSILRRNIAFVEWVAVISGLIGITAFVLAIWAAMVGYHTDTELDRYIHSYEADKAAAHSEAPAK